MKALKYISLSLIKTEANMTPDIRHPDRRLLPNDSILLPVSELLLCETFYLFHWSLIIWYFYSCWDEPNNIWQYDSFICPTLMLIKQMETWEWAEKSSWLSRKKTCIENCVPYWKCCIISQVILTAKLFTVTVNSIVLGTVFIYPLMGMW